MEVLSLPVGGESSVDRYEEAGVVLRVVCDVFGEDVHVIDVGCSFAGDCRGVL